MPQRRQRRMFLKPTAGLTLPQVMTLICGPGLKGFASAEAAKSAWLLHRSALMNEYGHFPWFWWACEAHEFPRPGESNLAALARLGVEPTLADRLGGGVRTRGPAGAGFDVLATQRVLEVHYDG